MFYDDDNNQTVNPILTVEQAQPTNVVKMADKIKIDPFDTKFDQKLTMLSFNDATDLYKLTVHLENLVATFGEDMVKAAIFFNLKMVDAPKKVEAA